MGAQLSRKDRERLQRARQLHLNGDLAGAQPLYARLIRKYPRHPDVCSLTASCHLGAGQPTAALPLLERLASAHRHNADAHYNLGLARMQTGDAAGAMAAYRQAIALAPTHAQAHYNLALAALRQDDPAAAQAALRADLAIAPRADTCRQLALLDRDRHLDRACDWARQSVALDGATAADLDLLVGLLYEQQANRSRVTPAEEDELRALAEHAAQLSPGSAPALLNLGRVHTQHGRFRDALAPLRASVGFDPDPGARTILGVALMTCGELAAGWRERAAADATTAAPVTWDMLPVWQGQFSPGLRLLVTCEQGVGDQILYAQMLPDLVARGLTVTFACDARLVPLLQRSFADAALSIVASESADATPSHERFDATIPIGQLHPWLRPHRDALPPATPYLRADDQRRHLLRARYQCMVPNRRLIGLSWISHSAANGASKSVTLEQLQPLFESPDVAFVCTQYGDGVAALRDAANRHDSPVIIDETIDPLVDIDGAAAQLAALDACVAVSNASVHLAGAMGKPTHVLVGKRPVWHWFDHGDRSPWYPDVALYRQTELADWDTPIQSLLHALGRRS